jgi:hypothetical protein
MQVIEKQVIAPPPPTRLLWSWALAFLVLMMSISSGFAQVGSITINGNQSVLGGSTWTYSIIGASCSQANWIILGGTLLSSDNISATVQWNNANGSGTVQVSAYGCSPTPESRTGSLNVSITYPCTHSTSYVPQWFSTYSRGLIYGHTYMVTITYIHNGITGTISKTFIANVNDCCVYTSFPEKPSGAGVTQACIQSLTVPSCPTNCY